jgi:predicted amidophosphoribosyltransferase
MRAHECIHCSHARQSRPHTPNSQDPSLAIGRRCRNCGADVASGEKFCRTCGQPLTAHP